MTNSKEEIEVKYLNIDKEKLEQKLLDIGAQKMGDVFLRHVAFDYPDYRLDKDNSWIRLRDEGDKIVLAFKKRLGVTSQDGSTNDEGMEEIEIRVDSYEETKLFLKKIGFIEKHGEAQKKRSKWKKGSIEFDIDTIAMVPTYLEIEAESWKDIDDVARELSLEEKDRKICSANQLLKIYGINTEEYWTINFDEVVKK
ncbi:MAG: Adenylate cyclase [Parcubacteria group bacterium Gr01-1014_46]|nr:MAG: Adenylate cyclase [Parcubacteria group bacterium Gr01-1014_46]